jgi:hypothetical protein
MAAADFILLDIGGSYLKTCTVEKGSQELRNIEIVDTPRFISEADNRREISENSLNTAVANAIRSQKSYSRKPAGILISGQMGGFRREGGNLITWQDRRVLSKDMNEQFHTFTETLISGTNFARTGTQFYPGLPLIVSALSQDKASNSTEPVCYMSVISSVVSFLTKSPNPIMHATDAAASGFYDVLGKHWILDFTNLVENNYFFPRVTSDVMYSGTSNEFNLDVYCGVGDQQASLLGVGLDYSNVVINIGTGGQVAKLKDDELTRERIGLRPYFENQLIETVTHLPAGRALKSFVKYCLGNVDSISYSEFFKLIDQNKTIGKIDISDFEGTLLEIQTSPHFDDFAGIAGSFFESMLNAYKGAIQSISQSEDLLFAGGVGQKFEMLSRRLGQEMNRRIFIDRSSETTLLGLSKITSII